jgi:transposase
MKLYCGIDLHSNNHWLTVIDETDRRLLEKRVANDLANTLSLLSGYGSQIEAIAVESTFNWYWLVDGLMAAGYTVKLVNTCAVQKYAGLNHADDRHDAFHLAHLLRLGVLPTDGYSRKRCAAFAICCGNASLEKAADHAHSQRQKQLCPVDECAGQSGGAQRRTPGSLAGD